MGVKGALIHVALFRGIEERNCDSSGSMENDISRLDLLCSRQQVRSIHFGIVLYFFDIVTKSQIAVNKAEQSFKLLSCLLSSYHSKCSV
jgi:hypothetical protein